MWAERARQAIKRPIEASPIRDPVNSVQKNFRSSELSHPTNSRNPNNQYNSHQIMFNQSYSFQTKRNHSFFAYEDPLKFCSYRFPKSETSPLLFNLSPCSLEAKTCKGKTEWTLGGWQSLASSIHYRIAAAQAMQRTINKKERPRDRD
jgi:hypothetical protein